VAESEEDAGAGESFAGRQDCDDTELILCPVRSTVDEGSDCGGSRHRDDSVAAANTSSNGEVRVKAFTLTMASLVSNTGPSVTLA
jgi:hypothetical protein